MLNCIAYIDPHVNYGSNNVAVDQYLLMKTLNEFGIHTVHADLLKTLYTRHIVYFILAL